MLGQPSPGHLPWTLIDGVDPDRPDDICFRVESFCSVWAETALEGGNSADFVERAVAFANDCLWGNLVAMLIVHPTSLKEPGMQAAVERAVADLRYGTVAVNAWSAMASMLGVTGWGAYPGNSPTDIQSGAGFVGNFLMLDHMQKNVIRRPFHKRPDPLAITTRNNGAVGRCMMRFEEKPGLGRLMSLMAAAMKG